MDTVKLFLRESNLLIAYVKWRFSESGPGAFPTVNGNQSAKNAEASKNARKRGNSLYNSRLFPSEKTYEQVWNLYSESIALAPNNSEELALGYGKRSALLFQIDEHKECIVDCDRALNITSSDYLRVKLLCRKAQSLGKLKKSAKNVSEEALRLLDKLELDKTKKNNFRATLFHEVDSHDSSSEDESMMYKKVKFSDANDLFDFDRSEEIPFASKSVAIEYNEKWGRHIVATKDIQPGEIIAVEKCCSNFPRGQGKYQFCGNCMKYLLWCSSIPCEFCAYNVYCNESCRKEAWEKFHQFECCFMIFFHSEENLLKAYLHPLRMMLLAVYEAGGLEQIDKQLIEIENTKDERKRGFTNGIFEEGKMKTVLGLKPAAEEHFEDEEIWLRVGTSCFTVYLLAKYTTFFGKKMNIIQTKLFHNKERLFTAALVLRSFYIMVANEDNTLEFTRYYLKAFGCLFNHSCDPNVAYCSAQYCNDIYYSLYPIKKGSQLFVAYHFNSFINKCKVSRQHELEKKFNFMCECIACKENWSTICLPSLKVVLQVVPSMRDAVLIDIVKADTQQIDPTGEVGPLTLKRELILVYLKLLSKHFTVYCEEYFLYLNYLNNIYATFDISFTK